MNHSGELTMYAASFSLGAALIVCIGIAVFGISAAMAGGVFVAALGVGAGIDVMRAWQDAAIE
jgi:hypothetical protein